MRFNLCKKIILTVFYKICFLSVTFSWNLKQMQNSKRAYLGYFNRFISDKLFYFVIHYYVKTN